MARVPAKQLGLDVATKPTASVTNFYADGTSGDDANTGLTSGSKKKTLAAIFDLLPDLITEQVAINLSGVFTDSGAIRTTVTHTNGMLVVDGGDSLTVLAGPWTADASSTTTIGLSTLTETVDAYAGYFLEITSGVANGETRTVKSNTATTFTVMTSFSVNPGTASFRIVRPSTELQGLVQLLNSPGRTVQFQRLYLSGASGGITCSSGFAGITHVISDSTRENDFLFTSCKAGVSPLRIDPSDFSNVSLNTSSAGLSSRSTSSKVSFWDATAGSFYSAYVRNLEMENVTFSNDFIFRYGTRIHGSARFNNIGDVIYTPATLFDSTLVDSSSGVGVTFINSTVRTGSLECSSHSSHGIELINSRLDVNGILSGSSNGGAGIYVHTGSAISERVGIACTLTGTVGDLSVDGVNAFSTWDNIEAGTPSISAKEATVIKRTGNIWTFSAALTSSTTAEIGGAAAVATRGSVAFQDNGANSQPPRLTEKSSDVFPFTPEGILLEPEAATNLFTNAESFNLWSKGAGAIVAVVADDETAPDGGADADKITVATLGGNDWLGQNKSSGFTASGDIAPSYWMKRISTSGTLYIDEWVGSGLGRWSINMANLPDYWVKIDRSSPYIAVTTEFTATAGGQGGWFWHTPSGTVNFHAWGGSLEDGYKQATSDMLSTGSTVTRSAAALRYTATGYMPSGTKGRVSAFFTVTPYLDGGNAYICSINDGGADADRIDLYVQSSDGHVIGEIKSTAGGLTATLDGGVDLTDGNTHHVELRWETNDAELFVDGSSVATDTSVDVPDDLDRIEVGRDRSGNGRPIRIKNLKIGYWT